MKNLFLFSFAVVLTVLPLQPYVGSGEFLSGLLWSGPDTFLGAILIVFYLYIFTTHQDKDVSFSLILISFLLSLLIIINAATGFVQPINATEVLRLIIVINMLPYINYLIRKFGWQMLALISIGIITMHAQWGIAQFAWQEDLGLYILGETRISGTETGIANFTFNEYTKFIRAYGPYSHANSLSGSLSIGFILILLLCVHSFNSYTDNYKGSSLHSSLSTSLKRIPPVMSPLLLTVSLTTVLGIFTTFSRAALLSLFFCIPIMFIYIKKPISCFFKYLLTLLVIITLLFSPLFVLRSTDPHDAAISERVLGYLWNKDMFKAKSFWKHAGPGQYETALLKHLDKEDITYLPWQIAPVHSVPLLVIAEWGLLTMAVLLTGALYWIKKNSKKKVLSLLLWTIPLWPLFLFDHYLITQTAPLIWLVVLLQVCCRALAKNYVLGLKNQSSH